MTPRNRRETMRLLAAATLTPIVAGSHGGIVHAAPLRTLPAGPMRLIRILERELSDGRMIVVRREWTCRFAALPDGIRVEGEQIACSVDAPARLDALAEHECARKETGPFPATLAADGMLIASGADATDAEQQADLDKAIAIALTMLRERGVDEKSQESARVFLSQLANVSASAISRIPDDLFYPARPEERRLRTLAVPGGETGSVETSTSCTTGPGGVLGRRETRILTRIGASERTSREIWELSPYDATGMPPSGYEQTGR